MWILSFCKESLWVSDCHCRTPGVLGDGKLEALLTELVWEEFKVESLIDCLQLNLYSTLLGAQLLTTVLETLWIPGKSV